MSTTTQPLSLGEILTAAREEKGVSLEQAAHETKIRAAQLREMENNNTFHFSHSSYARFFLRDYALYLGISRSQIEEYLPETGECSSDGMEYLNDYAKPETSLALYRLSVPSPRRVSSGAVFAGIVALLLLLSLGAYGWSSHNASDASKKEDSKIILVGDDDAKPVAAPVTHVNVAPAQNDAVDTTQQQSQKATDDTAGAPLVSLQTANTR